MLMSQHHTSRTGPTAAAAGRGVARGGRHGGRGVHCSCKQHITQCLVNTHHLTTNFTRLDLVVTVCHNLLSYHGRQAYI